LPIGASLTAGTFPPPVVTSAWATAPAHTNVATIAVAEPILKSRDIVSFRSLVETAP
jgi:hypothetical protein